MPQRKSLMTAFNLIPVVEQVLPDRPKTEVECVTACEKNLYMGTACGLVVYYQLEEKKTPLGKTVYQSKVRSRIQLAGDKRKPVQQLAVLPSQKKLLALVDGFLYVMNMYNLELFDTGQRVARIQCYCVNESKSQLSPDSLEIVVSPQRKKLLQLYALSGDKLVHLKDYSLPETAVLMARDGESVCVALAGQHGEGRYVVVNLNEGGKCIDLLSYEPGTTPIVKRTGKGEFLVNAGTFGVIAFASGVSNRPPVDWGVMPPRAASYTFPYVVAWSGSTNQIHVFSLLDQRCVQEIPFPNGRFLGDFSGKLYAALDRSIYLLFAVPLKEQVNALLDKQLVEEAVLLAESIAAVDANKNVTAAEEYMNEVKQRAAFIYFTIGAFSQAEALFFESGCDPREVIVLYDGLLPANSTFKSQISSLHKIPSLDILAMGELSVKEAKKFLIRYLKEVRSTPLALGRREDIDTSLVKLLAEDRSPSLIPYITNHDLYLAFEETREALEKHSCYHALGLLYFYSNKANEALDIWTRICDGELNDFDFPGFQYIVELLSRYTNEEVVLKYARWALERDEKIAVKIFTARRTPEQPSERMKPESVINFLSPFATATISYLEYLVHDKGLKEEYYHTKLAGCYLDTVMKWREDKAANQQRLLQARKKLKEFLESSAHYRAPELLSRVQDTDLHMECAILFGRMEEHERALDLLTHKLKDYRGAEDYCATYSQGRSRQYKQTLYQKLLSVYLTPKDKSHEPLIKPALSLLNSHGANFDAAQVLELLPPDWPIVSVRAFLMHSMRSSIDTSRTVKVERNLSKGENVQVRSQFIQQQGDPIVITESTSCPVCSLPFNDAAFVRYPNGIVTHLKCGRNKTICPVTGMWFGGE